MSLNEILGLLNYYQFPYVILFALTMIEGPIVTIFAGFLSSLRHLNLLIAFLVVVVGDITSDIGYYLIGRWGRERFIEKWGRYFGLTLERIEKIETHFDKHAGKIFFIGKMAHGLGGYFLVAGGLARVPFRAFFWLNFLVTVPKSLILILVGYYFGESYVHINKYLNYAGVGIIVALVLFGLFYYLVAKRLVKTV